MSRDMVVLAPNGRRVKVHCTADTSILQVLEDVCAKQGFQPADYDLKHHNKVLDLTTTVRFCNLPNKAMLEMVEAEKRRVESNVTVALLLDNGERRTGTFHPSTSLYDLIITLAPTELSSLEHPSILYMRQEVTGIDTLKDKSLRQLGLITGRAILRLLNKTESVQANVSRVYGRPQVEESLDKSSDNTSSVNAQKSFQCEETSAPGPSGIVKKDNRTTINALEMIKQEIFKSEKAADNKTEKLDSEENKDVDMKMEVDTSEVDIPQMSATITTPTPVTCQISQEKLERRLKIEEEVIFLGAQKAIAFMQPDEMEDELQDLPDDFYDLTIEEVRKMYHELQQRRIELENTPLMISTQRSDIEKQIAEQKQNTYKNAVVRIQFPDHMILQGIFSPLQTIEEVMNFIKEYLQNPDKPFVIFTTPLKEPLDPKMTLLEAKFVPCVHMHFKWAEENSGEPYLKEEIYLKKTSSDAASILASKYRAPTRRTMNETSNQSEKPTGQSSTSKQAKVPKWFKK
ncbi:unnamed protein product [Parnassius mnemosyne]|uniref:TUG ubiquitin-like domain-containing protein n=1 Tax=Parnassius mnemosyne TaxID=213953 RepID=A0AAV1KT05_9NEOP